MIDIVASSKKLKNLIENSNTIAICSHMNPDGDNLGSVMATFEMLKNMNKEVYAIIDDDIPSPESFLEGLDEAINSDDLIDKKIDLFITLDCGDLDRIGKAKIVFNNAKKTVNIDHHNTNTNFANLNIVDVYSPATCEILFSLMENMKIDINKTISTCLYTGISTDTGSFKYDSTRPSTHLIAAKLLENGIDINNIIVNLYQKRSIEKTNLLIRAMNNAEYFFNNKIGIVLITKDDIKKTSAKKSDADGIIEFLRDTEGLELAILLKEKDNDIRISTRSKSYFDCTKLVQKYNGGGHIRAAGGTIFNSNIYKAKEDIIKEAINLFSLWTEF